MRIVPVSSLVFHLSLAIILTGAVAVIGAKATPYGPWLGLIPLVVMAGIALRKPWRRWRLTRRPFPPVWRAWLDAHVPFYRALDEQGRLRFEHDILMFLDEHTFEAVEGVEMTDLHRLGVGAGAALLLHGRPAWELRNSRTILFYPDRFDEDYYDTDYAAFDGMVHAQGPIILSVKAVENDWAAPGTGHNVVLHELAHLFDFDDAHAEGIPSLLDPKSTASWMRLMHREMQRVRLGKSILRSYAATSPAEFFAVAVENFFDRPDLLNQRHPHLFEALTAFFNLDPRGVKRDA